MVLGSQFQLIDPQNRQDLLESLSVHEQLPALDHHIPDFIEGLEQAHLNRTVLFGLGESAAVRC